MFLALIVSIPYTIFISLTVFGGGQVFMPLFQQMWYFLQSSFGTPITQETIDQIFAIGNLTPGVFSTQLSIFTGILVANGQWWGFLAMFLTYVAFTLPSALVMLIGMRLMKKSTDNKYLKNVVKYMKPVIAGIIFALIIQLLIGMVLPSIGFNVDATHYIITNQLNPNGHDNKVSFFVGWRLYVTPVFIVLTLALNLYLSLKRKAHLLFNIVVSVILAFLFFQPWLT